LLLLRRPGVALALVAAAFVAALPAAAAPLFLSAARSATLHHQIAQACPADVGARFTNNLPFDDAPASYAVSLLTRREQAARAAAADIPLLAPPLTTLYASREVLPGPARPDDAAVGVTLAYRDGFADHVDVRAGPVGVGAWIPDQYAAFAGLRVGDTISSPAQRFERAVYDRASGPRVETVVIAATTLTVAAIYADLRGRPDDPYWCGVRTVYRGEPGQEFGNTPVPPFLLLDRETLVQTLSQAKLDATQTIEYPLADPTLTQPQAQHLGDQVAALRTRLYQSGGAGEPIFGAASVNGGRFASLVGKFARRADVVRRGLLSSVIPITGAGVLVGLFVVAAATVFWVQRRRRELTVLAAHGVGPAGLGLKAVTESLPALAVGAAIGWATAWALVRFAGPSPVISADAPRQAAALAGAALVAATLFAGLTAARRCRSLTDQAGLRRRRLRVAALPWELLLLAGAVPLWRWLGDSHETVADPGGVGAVAGVPNRLLIVPIMVVAGVAVLASRVAAGWLRRRATRHTPRRTAAFLAWRRLGREAAVAATLAAATAVPIALAAYGGTVTGSAHSTLSAEARAAVGADVVLTLSQRTPVPPALAGHATEVLRLAGADIDGVRGDILAIDPATFTRDAFWDDRIDGRSMADLVALLLRPRPGGLAVVASEPVPAGRHIINWTGSPVAAADITVVAALPAQQGGYPTLLMRREALGDDTKYAVPQLWVRGDPAQIRRQAVAARLPLVRITVAADRYADTIFEPLTYTFDYLTALSVLTGLIATVGLLLYLEGRAPAHRRAYVLLRRMGLRRRTHRWALARELAMPLLAGLVGGLIVAAGIVAAVRADIEINPDIPPSTVIAPPLRTVIVTVAAIALLTAFSAGYAHRRAARADSAEVLRDTV
jgi:putative ABC transport system permease protein